MSTELETQTVAATSPFISVERGGTHPEGATPEKVRPLYAAPQTDEQKVAECKQANPEACTKIPPNILAKINDAVTNQIMATSPRTREKLMAKRSQLVAGALAEAYSKAQQIKPNGPHCQSWDQVVKASLDAAIKHVDDEHHKEDAHVAHHGTHTTSAYGHAPESHHAPLPQDGSAEAIATGGVSLQDAAMLGAGVLAVGALATAGPMLAGAAAANGGATIAGAAAAKTAVAGAGLGKLAIAPVVMTAGAVSDKPAHYFENMVRGQRGEAPVSELNPSRAHEFVGPVAHEDAHEKASKEFQARIEHEREQLALQDHTVGGAA